MKQVHKGSLVTKVVSEIQFMNTSFMISVSLNSVFYYKILILKKKLSVII